MDFKNMGAKRVCVVTDKNVVKLDAMKQVAEGLSREGVEFIVYQGTVVEPKDSSYGPSMEGPGYYGTDAKPLIEYERLLILQNPTNQTPSLQWVVEASLIPQS